jgi:hypothetical protein
MAPTPRNTSGNTIDGIYEALLHGYATVAANQSDAVLGLDGTGPGAAGDFLEGLLCIVATAANSQVQLKDGAGLAITLLPANVAGGVGSYYVPINAKSRSGPWKLTTGTGVSVFATGHFS